MARTATRRAFARFAAETVFAPMLEDWCAIAKGRPMPAPSAIGAA